MGLETVELLMSWEEEFSISISDRMAETMETPRQAADVIEKLLTSAGRIVNRSEIEAVIKRTTLEIAGIDEVKYREDARFIRDFGLG